MMGKPFSPYSHEDEPFAQELFNEQASLPMIEDGELEFLPGDYDAKFTHVKRFERRSLVTSQDGPTIWFFGGSTLFGIGQRDEHTIPSEVARLAASEDTPVQVSTFGFPSFASWQEAGLMRRVLAERSKPDLVVFYHGVNDYGVICRQLALGITPNGLGNPLREPQPEVPKVQCNANPIRTGRLVAAAVSRAMNDARASLGDTPVIEFWQPFAATRRSTASDGPLLEALGLDEEGRKVQASPYRAALRYIDQTPVDLTDALDTYEGPVFFDWAHTNEVGAQLVAKAMWERSLRAAVGELQPTQ